jgi:hypothetical protein
MAPSGAVFVCADCPLLAVNRRLSKYVLNQAQVNFYNNFVTLVRQKNGTKLIQFDNYKIPENNLSI